MTATLMIEIDDSDLAALAAAAAEEQQPIGEMARLIVRAAMAVYRIENADQKPAGPMSRATRQRHWRRWRVDEAAVEMALATPAASAAALGDPPPGRSALAVKHAANRPSNTVDPMP